MDFAYLPSISSPTVESEKIRVPLLPEASSPRSPAVLENVPIPVIRAEILTVAADGTHIASPSAMYEVIDNPSVALDPYTLPEIVSSAAAKLSSIPIKVLNERPGMVKELWESVVDDLLGAKVLNRA